MQPFPTLWKHQQTLWFSDVFRGYRKGALATNWLKETTRCNRFRQMHLIVVKNKNHTCFTTTKSVIIENINKINIMKFRLFYDILSEKYVTLNKAWKVSWMYLQRFCINYSSTDGCFYLPSSLLEERRFNHVNQISYHFLWIRNSVNFSFYQNFLAVYWSTLIS